MDDDVSATWTCLLGGCGAPHHIVSSPQETLICLWHGVFSNDPAALNATGFLDPGRHVQVVWLALEPEQDGGHFTG